MKEKKIVLVTGGTSGIGYGTVEYLVENGNYEVISLSKKKENINDAILKLGDKANHVTFLIGDVTSEEDCERVYGEIEKKYHKLDGLVNCAGIKKMGGIEELTLEDWNYTINTNLTSIFILTKTVLPLLKQGNNASVVNISSMASEMAGSAISYCASKAGVDMVTKCLGKELAKYNIRVNAVNPGAVYTNIYVANGIYTQEEYDKISEEKKKTYPLGRIGDAKKDIAPMIEFLLSEKSLWTTGTINLINGGIGL